MLHFDKHLVFPKAALHFRASYILQCKGIWVILQGVSGVPLFPGDSASRYVVPDVCLLSQICPSYLSSRVTNLLARFVFPVCPTDFCFQLVLPICPPNLPSQFVIPIPSPNCPLAYRLASALAYPLAYPVVCASACLLACLGEQLFEVLRRDALQSSIQGSC